MKKVWIIVAAAVCLVAVCTSVVLVVTSIDPLVGTWTTTIGGDEGQMILKKDGTGEVVSNGVSRPCVWEVVDEKLTVVQHQDGLPYTFLNAVTYKIEGKTLTVTSQSGNTLVFKKK